MRKIGKFTGVVLASALALSACGTTAGPTTPEGTGDSTNGAEPSGGETVEFEPSEVVKPHDEKKLKIGVTFPILDQFLQGVADGMQARADEAGVELVIVAARSAPTSS